MNRVMVFLKGLLVLTAISSILCIAGLAAYLYISVSRVPAGAPSDTPMVAATDEDAVPSQEATELRDKLELISKDAEGLKEKNRILREANKRFEDEKAVILEQVRDSVSGFADYRDGQAKRVEELSEKIKTAESEKAALEKVIDEVTDESEGTTHLLTKQIYELNRLLDDHKADISKMKNLLQKREKDAIVVEAAKLHYNLGNFYFRNGEYEYSIAEYEKSLMYRPSDSDTHFNLAVVYDEHLAKRKKAIEHYKAYLALKPDDEGHLEIENRILDLELRHRALEGNSLASQD